MLSWLEWLFWCSLFLGLYPYFFYPMLAALVGRLRRREVRRGPHSPPVSVLISAYNEADCIEATVRNKLAQDYPGTLEVLVASDCSDDGTDDILQRLAAEDSRVRFFRQASRGGKTAALNRMAAEARGELIVFADANSIYRDDTVRLLVENFADPSVGYVTGRMVYVNREGALVGDGCSAYMRYENWLRRHETLVGSIVGVDGGVDAVRKCLFRPMRADQLPDFVLPLTVVVQGYRSIYDERAELTEHAVAQSDLEFRMRVRVALRAYWALLDMRDLLVGRAGPVFAWQLWSHKVLRYGSFVPLGVAAVAGIALAPSSNGYMVLALAQIGFWIAAACGWANLQLPGARHSFYFALVNLASLAALARLLKGERIAVWQPRTL